MQGFEAVEGDEEDFRDSIVRLINGLVSRASNQREERRVVGRELMLEMGQDADTLCAGGERV